MPNSKRLFAQYEFTKLNIGLTFVENKIVTIMKTPSTSPRKNALGSLGCLTLLLLALVSFNPVYAQDQTSSTETAQDGRVIKGIISDDSGPVEGATVILKGTKTGTSSNEKGEFTFPKPLRSGDVLLISYLGYKNQELKIDDSTNRLEIMLTEDLIEFTGALNSNKPYKSKRSK